MKVNIHNLPIGGTRIFVIAEIGNNHNGDVERALRMVDLAAEAGADCVKFQMRHLDEVYRRRSLEKNAEDLGTEYILDLLRRFELTAEEHRRVAEYCERRGIPYLCTPWDRNSIELLEELQSYLKAYQQLGDGDHVTKYFKFRCVPCVKALHHFDFVDEAMLCFFEKNND